MDWLTHTLTGLLGACFGAVSAAAGAWYFVKSRLLDLRLKESAVHNREVTDAVASDGMAAESYKRLADWQSDLFRRRYEDMEAQFGEMREALRGLHAEHMACLRKATIQDAKIESQEIRVAEQERRIKALESDLKTVLTKFDPLTQMAATLDHVEAEATLTRAENEKQTDLLKKVAEAASATTNEEKK